MSAEATGFVIRHSPFRGVAFAIHLSIADSVNDQYGYELWMAQGNLALKARTTRQSVNTAIDDMLDGGWLEVLEDNRKKGLPSRYRFLFPAADVVFDGRDTSVRKGVKTADTPGVNTADTPPGGVSREPTPPVGSADTPVSAQLTPGVKRADTNPSRSQAVIPSGTQTDLSPAAPGTGKAVVRVFRAWAEATGRSRVVLDGKRRRLIEARLKEFPEEDLVDAVKGWLYSPHHRGENPTSTIYNDIELILRDAAHVEKFRDFERNAPTTQRVTAPKAFEALQRAMNRRGTA